MTSEDWDIEPSGSVPLERISTGISGLDTTLMGGFLERGIYLIMAPPGSGKTILANQLAFHHAREGRQVVYVTLLAESHSRMFSHLQTLRFFDLQLVGRKLTYLSAYAIVEKSGLSGLLSMLQQVVRQTKPSILILDGAAVADELSDSATAFKKFVHQLNTFATSSGCTTFLLSSLSEKQNRPEHTMVDGIISMAIEEDGMRTVRELEVRKFRGSDHLHGRHYYRISDAGIQVYPRLESLRTTFVEPMRTSAPERRGAGIPQLDAMLGGGFTSGSTSLLLGAPGAGKTVLGLHFLKAGVDAGESCLYFGFYEDPARLLRKAEGVGLDCGAAVQTGALKIIWQLPLEHYMDEIAEGLLDCVRQQKVTRLFIDGVDGLRDGGTRADRMKRYMVALTNELRSLNVTTLISEETKQLSGEIGASTSAFSAVTENLVFMKQVEAHSELTRVICLVKIREEQHDPKIREFKIIPGQGIVIGQPFEANTDVLTGAFSGTEPLPKPPTKSPSKMPKSQRPKSKAHASAPTAKTPRKPATRS